MSLFDAFRYDGKRALVVGGATGMGAAATELLKEAGAEVVVMDRADVGAEGVKAVRVDLAERPSIDGALDACGGPLHALFACAGVADGTPGIERINFVGHRYLIEQAIERGMFVAGSAIGFISSAAGLGWEAHLEELKELFTISDFDAAAAWFVDHGKADYMSTKQAICAYVATEAFAMAKRGMRINAISPGPTETPLALANKELWLGFGEDFRAETGTKIATALEQAYPLVFLCSDAARAINGVILVSDSGYMASGVTGAFPPATPIANMLLNRGG